MVEDIPHTSARKRTPRNASWQARIKVRIFEKGDKYDCIGYEYEYKHLVKIQSMGPLALDDRSFSD